MQLAPSMQVFPHAPQLARSLLVSTHWPAQHDCAPAQPPSHAEAASAPESGRVASGLASTGPGEGSGLHAAHATMTKPVASDRAMANRARDAFRTIPSVDGRSK